MAASPDEYSQAQRLKEAQEALRREQRKNAKREDDRAAIIEAIKGAVAEAVLAVGRAEPVARPSRDRRKGPEVALLHLTDWQLGKVSESYSVEVCKERVDQTVAKTRTLREIQHADHPVRECHVMLGGDMVEGLGIFPGQEHEVEAGNYLQLIEAKALIVRVFLSLLEDFEHVHSWPIAGNHGRLGRRGDYPRQFNLDNLAYEMARAELDNQPRLSWHSPGDRWYQIVEIGESYRAMLVHGDQVKSFGGQLPAYGIMRKANSWAAGAVPEQFSDLWLGHLHQPMTLQMAHGGLVRMTPSTESGSAYAREFAGAHGRPGQRLAFVDPRKGRVTADYLLWLDE